MNPRDIFCPNMDCPARGQTGKGNIHIHSQKDKRYVCEVCQQTFTTTKGTIFYRLRRDPTADRIREIGEKWRPYRSIASWYLWQTRDNAPLDSE